MWFRIIIDSGLPLAISFILRFAGFSRAVAGRLTGGKFRMRWRDSSSFIHHINQDSLLVLGLISHYKSLEHDHRFKYHDLNKLTCEFSSRFPTQKLHLLSNLPESTDFFAQNQSHPKRPRFKTNERKFRH